MAELRRSFGFPLSIASLSDVGRVRTNNEDAHGSAWLSDDSLFVIVADGMGGHDAGEVASGLAVQVMEDSVKHELDGDPRDRLYNAFLDANDAILEEGSRSGTRGMGTTAVSAIIRGDSGFIGTIGDSRIYHVRNGQVLWRTTDHTRVQMLVAQGQIDENEARFHPEAGMLTRALGHARMANGRPLVPDVFADGVKLREGDTLIFSTDGLHDLVEDWEIAQLVAGKAADEAVEILVDTACDRGGHDNVTVAVVNAGLRASAYGPDYQAETYSLNLLDEGEDEVLPAASNLPPVADRTFDEPPSAPAQAAPQPALAASVASASEAAPPTSNKTFLVVGVVVLLMVLVCGLMAIAGAVYFAAVAN